MYELLQAEGDSYYVDSPVKVGVFKISDSDVVFIDGGGDRDGGKKALKAIQEQGWNLKAVFNTHAHADHIGGNAYLQSHTGCRIYAPGVESAFTRFPILEPVGLFGGNPISELKSKFTMAQVSDADLLTDAVLPEGMSIIELPGHSFEMVGFKTKDDVIYLADSLAAKETIEKYKITFLFDVQQYLDTLEKIRIMKAKVFVPAHAAATDDITELVDINIRSVNDIAATIWELCREPIGEDYLLEKLFDTYGLRMSILQYSLIGNTMKSYLSWLKESGKAEIIIEGCRLLWKSI